jgi:hypothetical protein
MNRFAKGALSMLIPGTKWDGDKIEFELNGVPITVYVIDTKYSFMKNPDFVFYRLTHFRIPNPFKKYWQVRGLIK